VVSGERSRACVRETLAGLTPQSRTRQLSARTHVSNVRGSESSEPHMPNWLIHAGIEPVRL